VEEEEDEEEEEGGGGTEVNGRMISNSYLGGCSFINITTLQFLKPGDDNFNSKIQQGQKSYGKQYHKKIIIITDNYYYMNIYKAQFTLWLCCQ